MDQLSNLKSLYEGGFISEEAFQARRVQIVDKLTGTKPDYTSLQALSDLATAAPSPLKPFPVSHSSLSAVVGQKRNGMEAELKQEKNSNKKQKTEQISNTSKLKSGKPDKTNSEVCQICQKPWGKKYVP